MDTEQRPSRRPAAPGPTGTGAAASPPAALPPLPAMPLIGLDQWRALLAVVDAGGYAQAAEVLHKSQSAITYAVQKIESLLGVKAFELQGRKAVLTPTGHMLYRRA